MSWPIFLYICIGSHCTYRNVIRVSNFVHTDKLARCHDKMGSLCLPKMHCIHLVLLVMQVHMEKVCEQVLVSCPEGCGEKHLRGKVVVVGVWF